MQETKTHRITLRLNRKVQRELKKMAAENKRSINSEIEIAIEHHLTAHYLTIKK